ncbi:class I SAM-dependent methyltransferase [Tateyamaria sp.]|uniref:class I SAM-dependent methyltransferase n=1 Tax=Tateyamaria sp. TaxID=1929288 RepID=UPI00329E9FC3
MSNIDPKTVSSFGDEWARFDQEALSDEEHAYLFDTYFHIFPWETLPEEAQGFDMGCGSGRWAMMVAPKVAKLTCIDPSPEALAVARRKLAHTSNAVFVNSGVSDQPLPLDSQDFGYSLGVLHHIPDTTAALRDCVRMLKPGAPFLVYLYYRFDNRPLWFALVWRASDIMRRGICRMPSWMKSIVTDAIAAAVYLPLARLALLGEKLGRNVDRWLLSSYRKTSFYTMRTDSRDRFGTPLEQRFTRSEVMAMMQEVGLEGIRFSDRFPFWCAVGHKIQTQQ